MEVDCTNSPLGESSKSGNRETGCLLTKVKPSYTTLILSGNYIDNVKLSNSNICAGKQTCFQYSHNQTSLRTTEALEPFRSVMIATHTHTHCYLMLLLWLSVWSPEWQNLSLWDFGPSVERDTVAEAGKETFGEQRKGPSDKSPLSWDKLPLMSQSRFPHQLFLSTHPILAFLRHSSCFYDHSCFSLFIPFHGLLCLLLCITLFDFPLHPCCLSSVRVYETYVFYLCLCVCVCCVKLAVMAAVWDPHWLQEQRR